MLSDKDIRKALIYKLNKENEHHSYRIINELGICNGESRVDIAVANGRLCGYEIKSDKDTLDRLPGQIEAYDKTFDKIVIVVGKKYEDKILNIVPEYWGIEVAYLNRKSTISLKKIRSAKINKNVEANSVLQLLWKEELKTLLKENNIKGLSNKNIKSLRDIAANTISFKKIKSYTREVIKAREGGRAD